MAHPARLAQLSLVAALLASLAGCAGCDDAGPAPEPVRPSLELAYVDAFEEIWWRSVHLFTWSSGDFDVRFYRPLVPEGFFALGHYAQGDLGAVRGFVLAARELVPGALAAPADYELLWDDGQAKLAQGASLWMPVAPPGYACLGAVAHGSTAKPAPDAVRCVREDLLAPAAIGNAIWTDRGSDSPREIGTWQVVPAGDEGVFLGTFAGNASRTDSPGGPWRTVAARAVLRALPTEAETRALAERHGPLLRFHSDEEYLPDDPAWILDEETDLRWGVASGSGYGDWAVEELGSVKASAAGLMRDVDAAMAHPRSGEPGFAHWMHLDLGQEGDVQPPPNGDLARATTFVRVVPWNALFTDLQFWIYYPFNGSGKFRISCGSVIDRHIDMNHQSFYPAGPGRHYGDWENVTVRVENLTGEIAAVYLSRHSRGEWFTRRELGARLALTEDRHPIVYSARDSHAHYPTAGTQYYERVTHRDLGVCTLDVDLEDRTNGDDPALQLRTWDPGRHAVVSSALPGHAPSPGPDWLWYPGRWGQTERLRFVYDFKLGPVTAYSYTYEELGRGPSGPPAKAEWELGHSSRRWWWVPDPFSDELCHDELDDDGDRQVDCADAGCAQDVVCRSVHKTWGAAGNTWAGDFNGDGRLDLATRTSEEPGKVYMTLSRPAPGYACEAWPVDPTWNGAAGFSWVGDFDGDGLADIAAAAYDEVYMKLSTVDPVTGSFAGFRSETWVAALPWNGAAGFNWAADFNGDGRTDIAAAAYGNVYLRLANATGDGFDAGTWPVENRWNGAAGFNWVGDFDGDGRADIAAAAYDEVYMKLSTVDPVTGSFAGFRSETWVAALPWNGAAGFNWAGDFDGDGRTDIAAAVDGNVYMRLANATGDGFDAETWTVENRWNGSAGFNWVGDFDGDGKADIAAASYGDVYMKLANATGTGFRSETWPVTSAWNGAAGFNWAGDVDGDGLTDIAAAAWNDLYLKVSTGTGFISEAIGLRD